MIGLNGYERGRHLSASNMLSLNILSLPIQSYLFLFLPISSYPVLSLPILFVARATFIREQLTILNLPNLPSGHKQKKDVLADIF